MKYLLFLSAIAVILTGCTATNPNWTKPLPGQPNTNTAPQYIPDPRIYSTSNSVHMAAEAVAPFNPYAVLTSPVLSAVFGLLGTIATWKAVQKNKVIDTMASSVVKSGSGQSVIAHSTNTDHFAVIANAVNNATGANQDNTGVPKT